MNLQRIETLFAEALAIGSAGERATFIEAACADDPPAKAMLESLLASASRVGTFLQTPVSLTAGETRAPRVGTRIGSYKLLERLGEGGCGEVFVAEQDEPVRRRVALKIIKPGMDSREVVARFEAERQALAMMDHPNIARVLEAGSTTSGRPYFVMELVRGTRITDFCDQERLPMPQRLELFIQVCHAVQHAHQQGIIHRDLKPSNILVTLHDGVPVPKVIDFGLAKATDQQLLTDKTLYTAFHQFVGTPAYMSPEQAEMSGLGIDTRTDVYALGVLLYELLTGSPPFESRTLLAAGVDEMRRIIREQEPPTPSTRLSTLRAGELDQTAGHRNTVAPRLVSLVRGDLDWIVMKALEKDRRRRYESAAALAREIEHHLRDEPVLARPPSAAYRLQKYVRRHRVLVATASMVGLTLLAGSVTSTWFAILEHRQRQRAGLSEMEARRSAYVSDMNLASQALGKNDLDRVRVLLDQHRPEPGGPDFRGWEWRYLWNASESDALFSVQAHEGAAYSVAFLTGGHQLASSGSDHTVALWDLESRQELRRWSCQSHPDDRGSVTALTLTPDGTLLLGRSAGFGTTGPWGTVLLGWRTADWTPDTPFRRLTEVTTIRVSPSGRLLAARNVSGKALLHDFATGRVLAELTGPSDRYAEIAFASGQPLVAAQAIDTIALWDTEKRVLLRQIPLEVPAGEYPCFAFTPDGAALAVGGSRPRVNVMGHPEESFSPMGVGPVSKLVFSPDGRRLVTVDAEGSVTVRNATDWSAERTLHGCLVRMISDMAISQDGRLLATTQGDGQVHVWNLVENPRRGDTLVALPSGLAGVAYSAGSAMACWWKDGRLRILGGIPELSQTDWQLPTTNRTVVAISPSGRLVCFRDDAGHIAIQDLPGAARVCTLSSEREIYPAGDQAFSPDESRLLTVEGAGTDYTLWEVQDGSAIGSFQTGARLAWWGADSRTLLVSAEEGRVLEILDAPELTVRGTLPHRIPLRLARQSRDGRLIATVDQTGAVHLWDAVEEQRLRTLPTRGLADNWMCSVDFHPDGTRLAVVGDGRVFVYDVESGRELVSPAIDGRARGCRFTRDGTRLAVLTYGGIQILASQIGSGERFQRLTIVDADHG